MLKDIARYFSRHREMLDRVAETLAGMIAAAAAAAAGTVVRGKKILAIGNGGSAEDAEPFVAEPVGRYLQERGALPAIALTPNAALIISVGNDNGFADIFRRQVQGLARPKDLNKSDGGRGEIVNQNEGRSTSAFVEDILASPRK